MTPRPFVPEPLSRAEAESASALFKVFQGGGLLRITMAGQEFALDLLPRPRPCQARLDMHLELGTGQGGISVWVGLEQDIVTDALAEFMTPEDGDSLPFEIRIALLEAVCEETLAGLSAVLGRPLGLAGLQEGPVDHAVGHPCLGFALTRLIDGRRTLGLVRTSDSGQATQLFEILARAAESTHGRASRDDASKLGSALESALDAIPATLRPVIGRTRISIAELRGLAVNDLLLMQDVYDEQARRFFFGPKQALVARIQDRQATIITILTETDMQTETGSEPSPLEDESQEMETGASQDAATLDLDGLGVELAFELGRETMTFGELRQLAPGQVFQLKGPTSGPVTVAVNGRSVARGELVDIEGRVGVRILELLAGLQAESDV